MPNEFITFEGGEGSGKSTQISLLGEAFAAAGLPYAATREPGGTPGAERIRALVVSGDHEAWDPGAETLLFYAARLEHVNKLIKPALAEGKSVLCDRFADSTRVYQGVGKDVSKEFVNKLHQATLGNFGPKLTFILDIDPAVGLKRAAQRRSSETRFENLSVEFHQKIRDGFWAIAKEEPQRCVVLDAGKPVPVLQAMIVDEIKNRLKIAL